MSCGTSCSGGGTGGSCSSCSGSCTGCDSSCSGCGTGCATCSTGCNSSCAGCTGCTGCAGTCNGYCDNGCTSSNASTVIANLGKNISSGNIIKNSDMQELQSALDEEFVRRSISYTKTSNNTQVVTTPYINQIFNQVKTLTNSSVNIATKTFGDVIIASDLIQARQTIQTLMTQHVKG